MERTWEWFSEVIEHCSLDCRGENSTGDNWGHAKIMAVHPSLCCMEDRLVIDSWESVSENNSHPDVGKNKYTYSYL